MATRMTFSECQTYGAVNRLRDYETMYYQLAAKVADAVEMLIEAQRQGELQCVESDRSELMLLKQKDMNKDENKD
jgi:hypothetical protein